MGRRAVDLQPRSWGRQDDAGRTHRAGRRSRHRLARSLMAGGTQRRVAVVLFNLGGPDNPAAVRPFLFNLFADPAIIGLPAIARIPLAALIAGLRNRSAKANYARMGGA